MKGICNSLSYIVIHVMSSLVWLKLNVECNKISLIVVVFLLSYYHFYY